MDAKLLTIYAVLFIVTSLLAGFYPALILSGYNPVQILYNRFSLGGKNIFKKFSGSTVHSRCIFD
jgi:putative ABC transport system permease protein